MALVGAAIWGCNTDLASGSLIEPAEGGTSSGDGSVDPTQTQDPYAFDDVNGTRWMITNCARCHGQEPDGTLGVAYSSWGMSAEFTAGDIKAGIAELQVSTSTPAVYQTIYNRLSKATVPSPMPTSADPSKPLGDPTEQERSDIIKALGWLYSVAPMAVAEAESRYGSTRLNELPGVQFEFSCDTPSTRRKFLSNLTYAAFDRPPTPEEIVALGQNPDQPITKEERLLLVGQLRTTWKAAFVGSGLRKLARYISGSGAIDIPPNNADGDGLGLSAAEVTDLKDELYASYRRHYDTSNYDDYFRSGTVAVTANTAPRYEGCTFEAANAVDGWAECQLQAPRKGFFTTLGFLSSKPSSFLEGNNNYGRVASMYFTIFGEALRPDTAGPSGGEAKPLPSCLEPTDTRYLSGGPIGSAAVPNFGAICQTCHISRAMAAGSVLFRRFSLRGLQYTPDMFAEGATPAFDAASFLTATAPDMWHVQPDTAAGKAPRLSTAEANSRLLSLLNASITSPAACIPTGRPDPAFEVVTDVNSFADYYLTMSDSGVARAFGRHANRAFANSNQVTFELAQALGDAYLAGRRKLPDLIETYFASETFACSETP